MNQVWVHFFVAFLLTTIASSAKAYDTETHALITQSAFDRSVLADTSQGRSEAVKRFGLDRLKEVDPFSIYWGQYASAEYYYNGLSVDGSSPAVDFPEAFERCQMQEFLPQKNADIPTGFQIFGGTVDLGSPWTTSDTVLPIQNWLVRGAIREDDIGYGTLGAASGINCYGWLLATNWQLQPIRSINHFYDPLLDQALTTYILGIPSTGERMTAWALGNVDGPSSPTDEDTGRKNHYTYRDARNALWWALTRELSKTSASWQPPYTAPQRLADTQHRMYAWATTFRALGDVVHLLEDAGQPQHTRNDPHSQYNTPEQKAFEDYTNDRVLGQTGDLNSYVRGFFDSSKAIVLAPPSLGAYPAVTFATPLRFFTTSLDSVPQAQRMGLADYTNRGFFTGGTLPGENQDPSPPPLDVSYTISVVGGPNDTTCEGLSFSDPRMSSVTCAHYLHTVTDLVAPTYRDELKTKGYGLPTAPLPLEVPLLSDSVFRVPIMHAGLGSSSTNFGREEVALGIAELNTIADMAIPRAVGYATGMLNYFFRGTLQVTAPIDGMYAIVNHGMSHTVDADGYPICSQTVASPADNTKNLCTAGGIFGFTSVRVNVQNTTPAATESGTNLPISKATGGTNAKMVAVARYHRNPCYKPDLSGEPSNDSTGAPRTPINCSSPRTAYPEISVSAEVPVSPGMLDGQYPVEQVFDFSNDPIPINATDLFIQVVYRGPLGSEADGISVGMVDVSEPTYDTFWAMTDIPLQYQYDGSTWIWSPWTSPPWTTYWTLPPPDPVKDLAVTGVVMCEGQWQIYHSTAGEQLPEDHVVRIATIRDFSSNTVISNGDVWQGIWGPVSRSGSGTIDSSTHQADDEQGHGWLSGASFYGRGIVTGDTGTYDYIPTCLSTVNGYCPASPFPPPSPWSLADVAPPASGSGFISEPIGIGNESLPRKTACPIH